MSLEPELVFPARDALLPGGLQVRRAIPQIQRRMVGPFVFIDQMGPATFETGQETVVLPHPHIGLATITYLFDGEGLHRDSLGSVQPILPGEVNWMTAGAGIVHSERMRPGASLRLFGVQIWVALPAAVEESAPTFEHYGAEAVPALDEPGVAARLIAGSYRGARSAVRTSSPLFYVAARLDPGAAYVLPAEHEERAVYVVEGRVTAGTTRLAAGDIAFFPRGGDVALRAGEAARVLLVGGAPLDGPRHIHWNFVSSSRDRLRQAAEDWRQGRFPRVPGETQYIPLPRDGSEPVNYP